MVDDARELVRLLEQAIEISERIDDQIDQARLGIQSRVDEQPHLKLHTDILVERARRETWALTRVRQNLIVTAKGCVDRLGNATGATVRLTLIFAELVRALREDLEDLSEFMFVLDRPQMEAPDVGLQGKDFQRDLSARVIAHRKVYRLWWDRLNEVTKQSAARQLALLAEALATARTLLD